MKRLYILGNGFDVAHKLPTAYLDYRKFLKGSIENEDFCIRMEDTYGLGENTDYWWKEFETNLGKGDVFESEFETMAESVIDTMITDEGEEMYDIEDTLKYHFEPYYSFMNKLNSTVLQWIESIDIFGVKPIFNRIIPKNNYFFTFNYTDVLEKVYNIPKDRICHIHGSATEGFVVMGHGNLSTIEKYKKMTREKEEKRDKNGAEISQGIYNFYITSFKNTKEIIEMKQAVFSRYMGIGEIHIFGHSLGEVDLPYFQEIKKYVLPTTNWYFYVYCQKEEFTIKKKEIYKKVERLRINRKHIHILRSTQF